MSDVLAVPTDPAALATLDVMCSAVAYRGRGFSFSDLAAVVALWRELRAGSRKEDAIEP